MFNNILQWQTSTGRPADAKNCPSGQNDSLNLILRSGTVSTYNAGLWPRSVAFNAFGNVWIVNLSGHTATELSSFK